MTRIIKFDFEHASVSIDSLPVEVGDNCSLIESIAKSCSPPIHVNHERTRYNLLGKLNVCGHSADGVIQVDAGKTFSMTIFSI